MTRTAATYLPRFTFILYLLFLTWLVLFKFSLDLTAVFENQLRVINLIPFSNIAADNVRETIYNLLVFTPFGLLLSVIYKQASLGHKLILIFCFSLAAESIQYILAIGRTDITDMITNTIGGFIGLIAYKAINKHVEAHELDKWITLGGLIALVSLIILRILLFNFSYNSAPRQLPPMSQTQINRR